tara:strand:- start:677 stop:1264 length:588 start_codon:yes stop_codon:yes gene_type:complete
MSDSRKAIFVEALKRLVAGEDGGKVAIDIQDKIGVGNSLRVGMTQLRNSLLEMAPPNITIDQSVVVKKLSDFVNTTPNAEALMGEVEKFEHFSLKEKDAARRQAKQKSSSFFSSSDMDKILAKSNTFVASVRSFKPSDELKKMTMVSKNSAMANKIVNGKVFKDANMHIEKSKEVPVCLPHQPHVFHIIHTDFFP